MINFLVYVLVLCIVFGVLYYVINLLPLQPPFKQIAVAILLLIFVLLLLGALFGQVPMPKWADVGDVVIAGTCVWAFRPLRELNMQVGFVECDDALAARLLAAGFVQNPQDGAHALNEITDTPPPAAPPVREEAEYGTKVMEPKAPPRTRK